MGSFNSVYLVELDLQRLFRKSSKAYHYISLLVKTATACLTVAASSKGKAVTLFQSNSTGSRYSY